MLKLVILNLLFVMYCSAIEQTVQQQQKDDFINLNNAPVLGGEPVPIDVKGVQEDVPVARNDEQAGESLEGAEQRWGWGGYGGYGRRWGGGGYGGWGGYGGYGGYGGGYGGYGRGFGGGWGRGWGGYGGWGGRRSFGYWG